MWLIWNTDVFLTVLEAEGLRSGSRYTAGKAHLLGYRLPIYCYYSHSRKQRGELSGVAFDKGTLHIYSVLSLLSENLPLEAPPPNSSIPTFRISSYLLG